MRQQNDDLRSFGGCRIDGFLQALFLDAESTVRYQVARIGDRRVRKSLADDRNRNTVDFATTYDVKTGSLKSAVFTFCAINSILP
jgi:hypothetical protein